MYTQEASQTSYETVQFISYSWKTKHKKRRVKDRRASAGPHKVGVAGRDDVNIAALPLRSPVRDDVHGAQPVDVVVEEDLSRLERVHTLEAGGRFKGNAEYKHRQTTQHLRQRLKH